MAEQIEEQERMLSNARKRFMMEEINAEDFKAKTECSEALRLLEARLTDMPNKAGSLNIRNQSLILRQMEADKQIMTVVHLMI